jgi:hypothetical protein
MIMDNVRPLFVNLPKEPVPHVVDFIERLLKRAKAGDVRAVAVAYVCGDGHIAEGWYRDSDVELAYRLHSAIACLMHEFTDNMNATSVDMGA